MARPRRGKSRHKSDDWAVDYFVTGVRPKDSGDFFSYLVLGDAGLRELWADMAGTVMRAWDHPGCRPWAWWKYDAPRLPVGTFPGYYYDGVLAEPRRLIGGAGCPLHQRLAYVPAQSFGIWAWFGDPGNPPTFESQHAYLRRHGLLLPREVAGPELQPHPPIEDAAEWARICAILDAQ